MHSGRVTRPVSQWGCQVEITRLLVPVLTVGLCVPAAMSTAAPTAATPTGAVSSPTARTAHAAPPVPTLVDVRAGHRGKVDRVVFVFRGGVPKQREVEYVDELLGEGSGLPVRVAGRAVLQVRLRPSKSHTDAGVATAPGRTAFALPNVMTVVPAGDFEAVTLHGIGLAKKTPFRVRTLKDPYRVVIRIRAGFRTVDRKVWFFHEDRFVANRQPFFVPRLRPVRPGTPATGVMDRLFAGPLPQERAKGLRLLRSRAKDYTDLSVADGIARVRLLGGCSSGGSTVSIAGEIMPTLRQFGTVDWVKIYDPQGPTEVPSGDVDSIPECLEP